LYAGGWFRLGLRIGSAPSTRPYAYGKAVQPQPYCDVLRRPSATALHVITGSAEEIQVEIETLAVIKGEADPRDTVEALEWAASNREELRPRWRERSEESKP
jgi:hypothetical protein